MLFFANPHSRCAMLTRGPFRTREHPLEAGRNCSSSHVPQSSQACPPKSSFHEPLFLAKKKSVHCSQGNNEVAHASSWEHNLGKGCSQPADILGWGKIHTVCKEPEGKLEWKATLTAVPTEDIWRALQGQPHRSSDTKVFLTYYPFQTGPTLQLKLTSNSNSSFTL